MSKYFIGYTDYTRTYEVLVEPKTSFTDFYIIKMILITI